MSYNILPDGITINTESKESKTEKLAYLLYAYNETERFYNS